MDNVLLLNSGGSVVQLDITDSELSKQIVKYSGFSSELQPDKRCTLAEILQ